MNTPHTITIALEEFADSELVARAIQHYADYCESVSRDIDNGNIRNAGSTENQRKSMAFRAAQRKLWKIARSI